MKSGRDPEVVYQELIDMGLKDVSMEVVGNRKEMYEEGIRLSEKFSKYATIKVPCTPDGLAVCRELSRQLIRVNVTLIFSVSQAILSAKAGANYVSPFVGRVDDNSFGGLCLIKDISNTFTKQNVRDVGRAFEYGADICTIPTSVFNKMYNHILTDKGLELFENDWKSTQNV
jgi:transaldolase